MRKFFGLTGVIMFFLLTLLFSSYAADETLTITTYYPTPQGSFNELRAKKMGIGENWYDSAAYPITGDTDLIVEGNVGIGDSTPTEGTLTVAGTGYFTSSVTAESFIYTSDRSLKKNIATIDSPLEKILKLRGVTFNWKKDGAPSVGLIAQEVEKVFPELVVGKDGEKGVQYGNLVAPLIEAVKEQQAQIDNLTSEIELLKSNK